MSDLIDTTEMYLRTIFELEEEGIVPLRARISERLAQSGPTVSETVARMQREKVAVERDQLERLVPVRQVTDLTASKRSLERELAMIKVRGRGENRSDALQVAEAFRARVVDATTESFIFELTGRPAKIDEFVDLMRPIGLVEVSRTGVVASHKVATTPADPSIGLMEGVEDIPGAVLDGPLRNVVGMRWDEEHAIGDVRFRFLAVQHWSARGLRDRDRTLWGSWAVLAPDMTFWFSGDLGYSPDILDVHASIGDVDLAAISIGAYDPRWIMRDSHLDPGEAVSVLEDLRARSAMAIHWGTFEDMTDEPLDEPPLLLRDHLDRRGIARERFLVPRHGETLAWDGSRLR